MQTDDLAYLQQAKAHADEGVIGGPAAISILGIAELATLRCRRMAQTIYLHMTEAEMRKSLPDDDVDYIISRKGGSVDYEPTKLGATMRAVKDADGKEVRAGSILRFSYGIPPVGVRATVIDRDGRLIALTPSHNPQECPVSALKRNVGEFWVER